MTRNLTPPTCTITPSSASLCTGLTTNLTVTPVGGNPPYTISWTKNGAAFAGNVLTITAVAPAGGVTDTYEARVLDSQGCTNTCRATVTGLNCDPEVRILKEVACWTPNGCDVFGKVATGVRVGTRCPSFCYRITVTNPSASVPLVNVTVTDPNLDLTQCTGDALVPPFNLAPGASRTCVIRNVERCSDLVNTVRVVGRSAFDTSRTVTAQDTAEVRVLEARIECTKTVDPTVIPQDGNAHLVTYTICVMNKGQVPLRNVTITDPLLVNCELPPPFDLAPGETRCVECRALLMCGEPPLDNPPLVNTATVTAQVDDRQMRLCLFDRNGRLIDVSTTCSARLDCEQPAGCRVTGGGRQDAKDGLVWPLGDPEVRYVTHGGQVGAPVGNQTEWDPNSPCIRGNWEHVRHFKGGRRANFHAKIFDSLCCACLDADGNVVQGSPCNKGDRVAGPEPRRAGANKITFTGVGDYTDDKGGRVPRSVIFRVDIEDRSEPGGFHPKGQTPPPDRYRIRIWKIVGDPNSPGNLAMRRAIACTAENVVIKDGVDVPLGTPVFGLPAPDVDDGGALQHGNHQLHPQIKPCVSLNNGANNN